MRLILGLFLVLSVAVASTVEASQCFPRQNYPKPPRDESIVDNYFGVQIKDPYRWLENINTPNAKRFMEEENKITRTYLDSNPIKREIKERLTETFNFAKYSMPEKKGNKYFYFKNSGLQNQGALYVQDSLDRQARLVFDPNTLSKDGSTFIAEYSISDDGATLAYGVISQGSDWMTIRFKDIETGKDYPDTLDYIKFPNMKWMKDNKGIFYSRYPQKSNKVGSTETLSNKKLYYHRLNTPQVQDVMVFEYPAQPLMKISATLSDDGKYLIVYVAQGELYNMVYYVDLSAYNYEIKGNMQFKPLISKLDARYQYITNEGSVFIFRTNKNAPNNKLVAIDILNPREEEWKDLVPEHEKDVLHFAYVVDEDKLMVHYIRDVKSVLQLRNLWSGDLIQEFNLDVGSISGFFGSRQSSEIFLKFSTFFAPEIIYYMDFKTKPYQLKVFLKSEARGFDTSLFEVKQVFYPSKDGTNIPMYILSRRGLVRDSSNPVLLTTFGGFGKSIQPTFDLFQLFFIQNFNGVVALPSIRGGGEYGMRWYDAGRLLNKQNSFDDFQAAAEYLINQKYTSPKLITIEGRFNGGLIVAASMNQRPDLFGAVIMQTGVLDMLRYNKFSAGSEWALEYGTSENKTQFFNLLNYSPLQNIKTPKDHRYEYPATLVMTSNDDGIVTPAHTLKYIATLQNAVQNFRQYRPLMARIVLDGSLTKSTTKKVDEYADILSFMSQSLALKFKNRRDQETDFRRYNFTNFLNKNVKIF